MRSDDAWRDDAFRAPDLSSNLRTPFLGSSDPFDSLRNLAGKKAAGFVPISFAYRTELDDALATLWNLPLNIK